VCTRDAPSPSNGFGAGCAIENYSRALRPRWILPSLLSFFDIVRFRANLAQRVNLKCHKCDPSDFRGFDLEGSKKSRSQNRVPS